MRKQARRLWLGDWQRGDQEQADTVTILPVDDEGDDPPAGPPAEQRRKVSRGIAGVAAAAVLFLLALALLSRGGDDQLPSAQSQAPPGGQSPQPQPQVPQPQVPQGGAPQGFGAPDLTGPDAVKAARAALARYPGNVERVTAGPGGGGYVVHVFQAGGCEVHVVVGDQFKVLGSDAGGAGGCGGGVPPSQGGSTGQS
jgi:hypothetical protein